MGPCSCRPMSSLWIFSGEGCTGQLPAVQYAVWSASVYSVVFHVHVYVIWRLSCCCLGVLLLLTVCIDLSLHYIYMLHGFCSWLHRIAFLYYAATWLANVALCGLAMPLALKPCCFWPCCVGCLYRFIACFGSAAWLCCITTRPYAKTTDSPLVTSLYALCTQ